MNYYRQLLGKDEDYVHSLALFTRCEVSIGCPFDPDRRS